MKPDPAKFPVLDYRARSNDAPSALKISIRLAGGFSIWVIILGLIVLIPVQIVLIDWKGQFEYWEVIPIASLCTVLVSGMPLFAASWIRLSFFGTAARSGLPSWLASVLYIGFLLIGSIVLFYDIGVAFWALFISGLVMPAILAMKLAINCDLP